MIATGGGIITVPDNVPRLRDLGLVIWLNPPEEILFQRIMRNHDRPLVRTGNPRQTVHDLLTLAPSALHRRRAPGRGCLRRHPR